MLIEKTTLIQFDEVAERARITSVFKGEKQKALLDVLDLMESGDFLAMARAVVHMQESLLEFMAIPIQNIVTEVVDQRLSEMAYADGTRTELTAREQELYRMRGLPFCPRAVKYPYFKALTDKLPVPSSAAPA